MESVDREAMCKAILEPLKAARAAGGLSDAECDAAIAVVGEGYSFPTNLDRDPPIGGLAPPTQQDLLRQAIAEGWSVETLGDALLALTERQTP